MAVIDETFFLHKLDNLQWIALVMSLIDQLEDGGEAWGYFLVTKGGVQLSQHQK